MKPEDFELYIGVLYEIVSRDLYQLSSLSYQALRILGANSRNVEFL